MNLQYECRVVVRIPWGGGDTQTLPYAKEFISTFCAGIQKLHLAPGHKHSCSRTLARASAHAGNNEIRKSHYCKSFTALFFVFQCSVQSEMKKIFTQGESQPTQGEIQPTRDEIYESP